MVGPMNPRRVTLIHSTSSGNSALFRGGLAVIDGRLSLIEQFKGERQRRV